MSTSNPITVGQTTHFVTLRLADQNADLLVRHIDVLRRAMRYTLAHHPMRIDAMAVMPNMLHGLWTLPAGDNDLPNRVGILKARFSRAMDAPADRTLRQIQRGQKGIWQRRYWQHRIADLADYTRHRDLIHLSPVHAGLCACPKDWPHSSVHRLETPAPALTSDDLPETTPTNHRDRHATLPLLV